MAVAVGRTGMLQRARPLRPDLFIIVPFVILSGLGILMVYSASAPRLTAQGLDAGYEMRRQVVFVVIGVAVFVVASFLDTRLVRRWVPAVYAGSVGLLVLVAVVGQGTSGSTARRWLRLAGFQLQPSELAKVAVILALAAVFATGRDERRLPWTMVARGLLVAGLPALLIFLQPDLGTMLVIAFVALVMLFVGGASWRQIGFMSIAALVFSVVLFHVDAIEQYQLERLTSFLDPASDPQGTGYNLAQSKIAIGSGGVLGKGLFEGTQTNLSFVPAQSTDFIFTAIGEQLGFVGGVIVIGLFGLIVWRLLSAAVAARDRFATLVAVGTAGLIVFHVFVNIGMTMQLSPVTGLPLPWVSHGGTAFVAMSLALGLAHGVWMRRSPVPGEARVG